jgi:peptidoglycan/xylan/chitin deacetylase (PgdA/CDA1 family)
MPPRLLFTIDVEEDMPGWRITDPITVSNVAALPRLSELCGELGVRATYLCTYPVATTPESAAILRLLFARGDCEIGAHLHAWNTPPFQGVPGREGDERGHAYYQSELGRERLRAKLEVLHRAVAALTGTRPRSFRAGRFGIDATSLRELVALGYEVDTSVAPLEEFRSDRGPDFRRAPQHPYRPARDDVRKRGDLPIVEIPVSVGLSRRLPAALQTAYVHIPRVTRVRGLLSRDYLNVLDFAWLYPVRFDLELMTKAARTLVAGGSPVLNVFVHSSELVPGMSGRVHTKDDVEQVFERLAGILELCLEEFDAIPCTLNEAARALQPALGLAAR